MLDDHSDSSLPETAFNFSQPLHHKPVMPLVGSREMIGDPKENDNRLMQIICFGDGIFQGVIVSRPLGGLHPVQDVSTLSYVLAVKDFHPFFLDHLSVSLFFPNVDIESRRK
jgi:hypothetical protein